jgi:glucokinase
LVPSSSTESSRVQQLAAQVLGPGDVALIISASGRKDELLAVADVARERGAAVLAVTASQTPLARKADVALFVDHGEDVDLQLPMVSRVLHLLMIDILAVGLSMQKQNPIAPAVLDAALDDTAPAPVQQARSVAPGVSAATPLARITSHGR